MYQRSSISPIIMIIIGLAGIGFIYRLVTEPMALFTQLLYMVIIGVIIFAIFKFVMQRRMGGSNSAFQRAARYSKKRFNKKQKYSSQSSSFLDRTPKLKSRKPLRPLTKKRNNNPNLTVIEGNGKKAKKKNRAFF